MSIKHAKVSAVADGADTSLVRPSDWNADHAWPSWWTVVETAGAESLTFDSGVSLQWRNYADSADIQLFRVFGTEFATDPGIFRDTQQIGPSILIDQFQTGQINIFNQAIATYGVPVTGYPHFFDGTAADPEGPGNAYTVMQFTGFVAQAGDGVHYSALGRYDITAVGAGIQFGVITSGAALVVNMIGLPTADPVVAGRLWNSAGTLKVSAG